MKRWCKIRIQQKLIAGFLAIALLISILGVLSINASQKALQKDIGERSALLAAETIDKIDRSIYYKIERWMSYARTNIRLEETLAESNQEFEDLSNRQEHINEIDRDWAEGKNTPFIQEILNNELSRRLKLRVDFYEEKSGFEVFPELFATNKYGVVIASTKRTSDYLQADEEWYQTTLKEKEFWVSEIEYDESSDSYALGIFINIYDENENFTGILKVILNIEELSNILNELELRELETYKTIEYKLLTRDGKIIYSTEKYEIFEDLSEMLSEDIIKPLEEPGHRDYFIAKGDMPGEKEELFSHAHSKGYRNFKSFGWILVVEHETKEIFAPVAVLRNRLIIISIILTIVAVWVGLFLSKYISKPIHKLIYGINEIKKGNLDYEIKVISKDEIGKLAETCNEMRLGLNIDVKDRNELLNSLLKVFKGKFGKVATILMRKNIQELIDKNPRIKKIIPKGII